MQATSPVSPEQSSPRSAARYFVPALLLFAVVWLMPASPQLFAPADYLILHNFLEFFAIAISVMVFAYGWSAYGASQPRAVTVIAAGFLAVALIDLAHMFSYTGMPDFVTASSPNKAIHFWLMARLVAVLSILAVVLGRFPQRAYGPRSRLALFGSALAVSAACYYLVLFQPQLLPLMFVPGAGLTPLKIGLEYALIALHLVAMLLLVRRPGRSGLPGESRLVAALGIMALSELCFTLYTNVHDGFNMLGHVYKAVAYYLIYRSVFVASVRLPFQQLKASEAALKQSEGRMQNTLDNLIEGCQIIGPDWRYLYLNRVAVKHARLPLEALLGRTMMEVFPGIEQAAIFAALQRCMERRAGERVETEFVFPDGSRAWFDLHIQAVPEGLFVLSSDITERKLSEQVREHDMRLAFLRADVNEALGQGRSPELMLRRCMDAVSNYLGGACACVWTSGQQALELRAVAGDCPPQLRDRIERVEAGEHEAGLVAHTRQSVVETRIPEYSGQSGEAGAFAGHPLLIGEELHGVMGAYLPAALAEDAMEAMQAVAAGIANALARCKVEEELRALNADLEQRVAERTLQLEAAGRELVHKNLQLMTANQLKSEFLANMSHELRTPLNAVIGFSEVLRDGLAGELNPEQKEYVTDIFLSGEHLLELINDILDLSKIETGMMVLDPEPVDVESLLGSAQTIIREKAARHAIRLGLELAPDMTAIEADPRKLKQILFNLLSNAVKFTPDGGRVTLGARRVRRADIRLPDSMPGHFFPLAQAEEDEFLELWVSDTGIGIPQSRFEHLFQPFVQVDSSPARRHSGTGLGLAMIRRLAELHGGTVGVSSSPERGSRFVVWIPYRHAEHAAPRLRAELLPSAHMPADAVQPQLALIVEDDDRVADAIARQLHKEGYASIRAATAEEGLVRAAKQRPRLITLDIFLPSADGWEFISQLKANPAIADTPVVIVSVSSDLARGLALGATRVLQKPFTQDELAHALAGLAPRRTSPESRTVLLVADAQHDSDMLATRLMDSDIEVLRAYTGQEALASVRRKLPDLIVLDLSLPGMAAFDLAQALERHPETASIPLLALTGRSLTAAERLRLNGSLLEVMEKASFSVAGFAAEVRRALNDTQARQEDEPCRAS